MKWWFQRTRWTRHYAATFGGIPKTKSLNMNGFLKSKWFYVFAFFRGIIFVGIRPIFLFLPWKKPPSFGHATTSGPKNFLPTANPQAWGEKEGKYSWPFPAKKGEKKFFFLPFKKKSLTNGKREEVNLSYPQSYAKSLYTFFRILTPPCGVLSQSQFLTSTLAYLNIKNNVQLCSLSPLVKEQIYFKNIAKNQNGMKADKAQYVRTGMYCNSNIKHCWKK